MRVALLSFLLEACNKLPRWCSNDVKDLWEEDPRDQLSADSHSKADGSGPHRRGIHSFPASSLAIDLHFLVSEQVPIA
jgi:hypothetical protein